MTKFFKNCFVIFVFLFFSFRADDSAVIENHIAPEADNISQQIQQSADNRNLEGEVPQDQTEVKFVDMFLSPSMIRNFIMLFASHRLFQGPQDIEHTNKLRIIDLDQEKIQLALANTNLSHEAEEVNLMLLKASDSLDFYQSKILGEIAQYRGIAEICFSKKKKDQKKEKRKKRRRKRKLNSLRINDMRNQLKENNTQLNDINLNTQKRKLQDKIVKLDEELKLRSQILDMEQKIRQQIDKKEQMKKLEN